MTANKHIATARTAVILLVALALAGCAGSPDAAAARAERAASNANERATQLAAVRQSLPAALQGDADAEFEVGAAYEKIGDLHDGSSGANNRKAVTWYRLAATQGHSEAQRSLGAMLINRQGVQRDRQQALVWFQRAADQGNAKAQLNLAALYEEGLGVAEDHDAAVTWYQRAALNGDPTAQASVAGLPVDESRRATQ